MVPSKRSRPLRRRHAAATTRGFNSRVTTMTWLLYVSCIHAETWGFKRHCTRAVHGQFGTTNRLFTQACLSVRGGDVSQEEENRQLDEYIEQLVASVDSSELDNDEEEQEEEGEEEEEEAVVEVDSIEQSEEEEEQEDENEAVDMAIDNEEDKETDDAALEEEPEASVEMKSPVVSIITNEETKSTESADEPKPKSKRKRKKKQKATADTTVTATDAPLPDQEESSTETSPSSDVATPTQPAESTTPATMPYRRPNALYRFLLGQGRVGHVIVMTCVLAVEWIQTFIPMAKTLLGWIFVKLLGSPSSRMDYRQDEESDGRVQSKVNKQYGAFVSTDGSSVRGKQRKKLAKQADQKAAKQLRLVGSIRQAKYRHVSIDFMKRHGLGPYGATETTSNVGHVVEAGPITETKKEEEEESDVDWVVEALTPETSEYDDIIDIELPGTKRKTSVKPSVSVGMGTSGASVSVGVEFGIGGSGSKKKKKKTRKSVAEIVTQGESSSKTKKKASGPRASDRDGGGGLVGRLRSAVGSNIPSSLLGAYPGDAVPVEEAASADGVVALARKYGYGDWSDSEDDDEGGLVVAKRQKKKRRKVVKKTRSSDGSGRRRRKSTSRTQGGPSLSVGFEMSLGDSRGRTRRVPTTTRTSKTRRRRSSSTNKITTDSTSSNTSPRSTSMVESIIKTRDPEQRKNMATEENRVRLPMERMEDIKAKIERKKDQESN